MFGYGRKRPQCQVTAQAKPVAVERIHPRLERGQLPVGIREPGGPDSLSTSDAGFRARHAAGILHSESGAGSVVGISFRILVPLESRLLSGWRDGDGISDVAFRRDAVRAYPPADRRSDRFFWSIRSKAAPADSTHESVTIPFPARMYIRSVAVAGDIILIDCGSSNVELAEPAAFCRLGRGRGAGVLL